MVSLKEMAALLVKYFDYHEGLYDISFALQVGIGPVGPAGPTGEGSLPGAAFAIAAVGLTKAEKPTQTTVDAAEVNPLAKPAARKPALPAKKPRKAS
jgi:hypothetical protein